MRIATVFAAVAFITGAARADAACERGIYGSADDFVVIGAAAAAPGSGQRYLFRSGLRGNTGDAASPVKCDGQAIVFTADGRTARWMRQATVETATTFTSAATELTGQLIEPAGPADPRRPLVVMVHGSEKTSPIGGVYAYMPAAQGVSVFVYDKRGTGASGGDYTQNFELLADDAAAALNEARRMARGRFGRSGYFGGSQGGWVAPLAATRSPADFVAVGFGLVESPIEEDRGQLLDEAQRMALTPAQTAQVEALSRATAAVVRSHFTQGFAGLAAVRRDIGDAAWRRTIKGEYSGDMLRMNEADLRRIGAARFDNLGLIWDYDAVSVLRRLKVPLLWVLAGEDREAPIASTRKVLAALPAAEPVTVYLFPETDHGMVEYRTAADGSRTATRITDGYLKLLADWIKQSAQGGYGRGQKLR